MTIRYLPWLMCVVLLCASCGVSRDTHSPAILARNEPQTTNHFPITIENCGRTTTYHKPPERVIVTYPSAADLLERLGLGHTIVASLWHNDMAIVSDTAAAHRAIPHQFDHWMTAKQFADLNPDFVLSAYDTFDFNPANGMPTVEAVQKGGTAIYAMSSECGGGQNPQSIHMTIDTVYADIMHIGAIFGVEARAHALVDEMRSRIAAVHERVADRPPLKAFIYHGGDNPLMAMTNGRYGDMLRLAGAHSILFDADATFVGVDPKLVIARNPDVFVVIVPPNDSQGTDRAAFLRSTLPTTAASQQNRIVTLLSSLPAGFNNVLEIEAMARAFHRGISTD